MANAPQESFKSVDENKVCLTDEAHKYLDSLFYGMRIVGQERTKPEEYLLEIKQGAEREGKCLIINDHTNYQSLLFSAACRKNITCFRLLIQLAKDSGVSVDLNQVCGEQTLIAIAAHNNDSELFDLLLQLGANKYVDYYCALFRVADDENNPELIHKLMLFGADPNIKAATTDDSTALHQAAVMYNLENFCMLLAHPQINPNITDKYDNNVLEQLTGCYGPKHDKASFVTMCTLLSLKGATGVECLPQPLQTTLNTFITPFNDQKNYCKTKSDKDARNVIVPPLINFCLLVIAKEKIDYDFLPEALFNFVPVSPNVATNCLGMKESELSSLVPSIY